MSFLSLKSIPISIESVLLSEYDMTVVAMMELLLWKCTLCRRPIITVKQRKASKAKLKQPPPFLFLFHLTHSDTFCDANICTDLGSMFQDGWVGFKMVLLKKRLTAADFYNGYLHQAAERLFVSKKKVELKHDR